MTQLHLGFSDSLRSKAILVFAEKSYAWLSVVEEIYSKLVVIAHKEDLISSLLEDEYATIILDKTFIKDEIGDLIQEIKSRFPLIIIIVLATSEKASFQDLLEIGVDDVVDVNITSEHLLIHLDLLLRQQQQNSILLQKSDRLHAINILSHQFYDVNHPSMLIAETIELLCLRMGLSGVAIVIADGDNTHLYAGSQRINQRRQIYESTSPLNTYDPLYQTIISGASLIINDISVFEHYTPIPVINNPKYLMVLPLKRSQHLIGAIGFFSNDDLFTIDDLVAYELLATHFAIAYYNVRHQADREADMRYKRQQLRILNVLSNTVTINELLKKCYELIWNSNNFDSIAIFVFQTVEDKQEIVTYSNHEGMTKLIDKLHSKKNLTKLMEEFDADFQSVILHERQLTQSPFAEIFEIIGASQVLLCPISANTLLGGVLVSGIDKNGSYVQEKNLIENIVRITAQTLERNMLIEEIQQQKGRLEAVIRSIREAVFFVNPSGHVIFCNPQFTELTGIKPSDVIMKSYEHLFEQLALQTDEIEGNNQQLQTAFTTFISEDVDNENYPIIELRIKKFNSIIYIEFIKSNSESSIGGWIGLIRTTNQGKPVDSKGIDQILDILENSSIPLFEMQKTIVMLPEQYDILRPSQYIQLLGKLQNQAQGIQSIWKNLMDIYEIETRGLKLQMAHAYPDKLIEEFSRTYLSNKVQREIDIEIVPPSVHVNLDERYFLRVLSNVIGFLSYYSQVDAQLFVQVSAKGQQVTITIQDKSLNLSEKTIHHAFDISTNTEAILEDYPYRLGLYVSRLIINEHGGELEIVSKVGLGTITRVYLPIAKVEDFVDEDIKSKTHQINSTKLSIIVIENVDLKLDKIYDILRFEGHDIFIEHNIDDALIDLSLTQVDLIILVCENQQNNLAEHIQSLRKRTNTPILLIIDPEIEQNAIRALAMGADGYILTPITIEKITAQIQSVANRKDITARITPPVDVGKLHINFSRRSVYLDNEIINLTGKEYEVLQFLAMNKGQILTHEQILTHIWGPEYRGETHYLWVSISRLRSKLEPQKNSPRYIHTEKGVGYVLEEGLE